MTNGPTGAQMTGGLPRPGKALKGVLLGLLAVWLMYAVGLNWANADQEAFLMFCGSTQRILDGEVWRFVLAPVLHYPIGGEGVGHLLFALLGLYFLSPTLEQQWGPGRFLRFLLFSAFIAYGFQMLLELLLPAATAQKLVGEYWFGAFPVVEAVAIAWAMTFRGQTVRLMFILPVTSTGLIIFVVAISLLRLVAVSNAPEGLLSPFGGMAAGYLLGGGSPSPLRRLYLRLRLRQMERQSQDAKRERRERVAKSGLRVIEGGRSDDEPSDDERGPDGKWLN